MIEEPMKQQIEVTLKLSLWLDATMDEDEIVTHVRASLPKAFGEELTVMDNPVDILEVREEAEIYGVPEAQAERRGACPRLLAALTRCSELLADHDQSEGEEGEAYREAVAAIAEANGLPSTRFAIAMDIGGVFERLPEDGLYDTRERVERAIKDHIANCIKAVEAGELDDSPDPSDFRAVEVAE